MNIEYNNGKMIITHPSGHIDTYDKTHLEQSLEYAKQSEEAAKAIVEDIESHIGAIDDSVIP